MKIIGISGKMGSGKTTLAQGLIQYLSVKQGLEIKSLKFADPLYATTAAIQKTLGLKEEKDRALLQYIGSHYRETYGPYFWASLLERNLDTSNGSIIHIIDDLRYEQEYEVLNDLGAFLIRLDCPIEERAKRMPEGIFKNLTHPSETALDDENQFNWAVRLNTGFITEEAVTKIVLTHLKVKGLI